MIVYLARDIPAFIMYCVNGESGSSLLIESTDSMIKDTLWENVDILNETNSEDRVWIKTIVQTPCNLRDDIYACSCHMPSADSTSALHEGSQWNSLEVELLKYSMKGHILLCGDLNARTCLTSDFIADDFSIPISSPPSYVVDNEIPRQSKIVTVNTQGRHLLDLCIGSKLRIVNGRFAEGSGDFTFYTPRSCSVVDYVVISAELLHDISDFKVEKLELYSNHCHLSPNHCGYIRK